MQVKSKRSQAESKVSIKHLVRFSINEEIEISIRVDRKIENYAWERESGFHQSNSSLSSFMSPSPHIFIEKVKKATWDTSTLGPVERRERENNNEKKKNYNKNIIKSEEYDEMKIDGFVAKKRIF